jgi:hypothetical protein
MVIPQPGRPGFGFRASRSKSIRETIRQDYQEQERFENARVERSYAIRCMPSWHPADWRLERRDGFG